MSFEKWRARLAGREVVAFLQPNADDEGYYRKPIAHKDENGNGRWTITDWIPVAIFLESEESEKLTGLIGAGRDMRDMTEDDLLDEGLWSWIVGNPISYEVYKAVAEDGQPWPDSAEAQIERTEGRRAAENQSAGEEPKQPETAEEHRTAIKTLVDTAKATTLPTSDAEANIAAGTMNLLAERRLAADKAGKALYKPPFEQYKKLYELWHPMVEAAQQAEKRINSLILTWREKERQRLAKIAEEQVAQAEQERAANERAADRAIAAGEEPTPPLVEQQQAPTAPAPINPTYGKRKVREELKTFVLIKDEVALCTYYRGNEELLATLLMLAERDVKRGVMPPGVVTEERLA